MKTEDRQRQAIEYMAARIATLVGTSKVMNDNGVQVMVIVSKGVWDSLEKLVTDENGRVNTGIDPMDALFSSGALVPDSEGDGQQLELLSEEVMDG